MKWDVWRLIFLPFTLSLSPMGERENSPLSEGKNTTSFGHQDIQGRHSPETPYEYLSSFPSFRGVSATTSSGFRLPPLLRRGIGVFKNLIVGLQQTTCIIGIFQIPMPPK